MTAAPALVLISGTDEEAGRIAAGSAAGDDARLVSVGVHAEPGGLTDLVEAKASRAGFERRVRERWASGAGDLRSAFDERALDAALERLAGEYLDDPVVAARTFLLGTFTRLAADGDSAVIDLSPDNLRYGQLLTRILPEARFVSAVRDGRTAAADGAAGLEPWEARIRYLDEGVPGRRTGRRSASRTTASTSSSWAASRQRAATGTRTTAFCGPWSGTASTAQGP
jgi:hypothetical protein